jgi:NADH-ubiquinone oxidoreductase chain 2
MITISILILIVAKALPVLNTKIYSIHVTRITTIVFLFAAALTLNTLNLENIGSGLGVYSGFFQITTISQLIEIFLFLIGGGILMAWPLKKYNLSYSLHPNPWVAKGEALTPPTPSKRSLLRKGGTNGSRIAKIFTKFESTKRAVAAQEATTIGENLSPNLSRGIIKPLLNIDKETPNLSQINESADSLPKAGGADAARAGTDYSLIVLFSSLGSSLLISSYDLISVYLSIELQSFGLYVLSTLYRDSESATSSGLKYFLLGGLSSCIILLGAGIIYSYTGTTNLESLYIINSVIDVNQQYIIQGLSLGLSLIFIGFLFKIAAAPLHNWSPDVYDGTPTIVTTWLTIIPKIAILFILLELQIKLGTIGLLGESLKTIIVNNSGYLLNLNQGAINEFINLIFTTPFGDNINISYLPAEKPACYAGGGDSLSMAGEGNPQSKEISIVNNNNILKTLLLISATLSLIIGSLLGLAQIRIKRLLAYSTISHIGFILLALAVNTEQSIDSFIFYIIQYTLTNLNIFLVILGLAYINNYTNPTIAPRFIRETGEQHKDINYISEFKGLFFSNPILSISLAVSLFSMAGIPPLIGFFSKQLVLYSALQNGYYFISVLAIIVSVISCSYYLQIIKILFTPSLAQAQSIGEAEGYTNLPSDPALYLKINSRSFGATRSLNTEGGATTLRNRTPVTPVTPVTHEVQKNEILLTNTHSYLISTLTFTILFFFIKPSLILNSTQLLSLSLFYI